MGLFGDLFGKKEPVMGPADLSVLGADIHSHFIPGIDDGSQSLAQSMELLCPLRVLLLVDAVGTESGHHGELECIGTHR